MVFVVAFCYLCTSENFPLKTINILIWTHILIEFCIPTIVLNYAYMIMDMWCFKNKFEIECKQKQGGFGGGEVISNKTALSSPSSPWKNDRNTATQAYNFQCNRSQSFVYIYQKQCSRKRLRYSSKIMMSHKRGYLCHSGLVFISVQTSLLTLIKGLNDIVSFPKDMCNNDIIN